MAGGEARWESPAQRLGGALRALQQSSGRTLRSLEAEVAISDSSLSRYLRGTTVPPWATVRDLCRALGGDPADYRTLWEAAGRSQSPAGTGERLAPPAPTPAAEPVPPGYAGPECAPARRPEPEPGPARRPEREPRPARRPEAEPRPGHAPEPDPRPDPGLARDPERGPGPLPQPGPEHAPRRTRRFLRSRRAVGLAGVLTGAALGSALTALVLAPSAPGSGPGPEARNGAGAQRAAAAPAAGRLLVNRSTGACLDDSLDARLRGYVCNALSYQRWTVRTGEDGTSSLRNHATGGCLAQGGSGPVTAACGTSGAQKWKVTALPDDAMEVRNAVTGDCLDDGPTGLRTVACGRTAAQKWA
ncbi:MULTISPECIES: helix-turn-helix domain-containing protein [unclassified Streptomyces]|uniref:helix-turn-helix domain-containing protein n=1 Tax=unclassified Streptomyces TaxID=2593676 RepID=UPI0037AB4390